MHFSKHPKLSKCDSHLAGSCLISLPLSDLKQEVTELKMCCSQPSEECEGKIPNVTTLLLCGYIVQMHSLRFWSMYFIKQTCEEICSSAMMMQTASCRSYIRRMPSSTSWSRSYKDRTGRITNCRIILTVCSSHRMSRFSIIWESG